MHAHEHLVVFRGRAVDLADLEHIGPAVPLTDDCFHTYVVSPNEIELPATEEWEAAIRECAISAHDTFIRHPWAGFSEDLTYHAYHALDSHILGFTLWELGHAAGARQVAEDGTLADVAGKLIPQLREQGFSNVAEHAEQYVAAGSDGESEFEFSLDLILEALERARATR